MSGDSCCIDDNEWRLTLSTRKADARRRPAQPRQDPGVGELETLAAEGDPATALFTFFENLVERAAAKKTVVELLDVDIQVSRQLDGLRDAVGTLLIRAQEAGAVRGTVKLDEVLALLTATSHSALRSGWDSDLRQRTLGIVFAGLRPV